MINTLSTLIKYYKHKNKGDHFSLASVSESSILTVLKATQVSEGAGLGNLSGCLDGDGDGAKVSKHISDLFNLLITSERYPDSCEITKFKPLCKKGSLSLPYNYRPISLLHLISKVIEKVIYDQATTFLNLRILFYTCLS